MGTGVEPGGTGVAHRAATPSLLAFSAVMTAAMTVATLLPFALGALAPFVTEEFDLTRSRFGTLTTALFVVAAILSPAAGRLSDRLSGRLLVSVNFLAAGFAFVVLAVAGGYPALLLGCVIAGLPQALSNPLTNALVSRHVRPGRQGVVIGVKQSGVQIGVALAGLVLPASAVVLGWRATVLAAAGVIVLLAAVSWPVVGADRPVAGPEPEGGRTSIWPTVRWLSAYAVLMGASGAAVGTYLPLFGYEELGMDPGQAGRVAAVTGIFGVISRIVWGWLSERATRVAFPLGLLAAGAVAAHVMILAAPGVGPWLLWAGAVAFGSTAAAWNSVGMLAILRLLDPADAGRASGWILTAFFIGFIVSPPLFGYVVDVTGEYVLAWSGITLAVTLAGLLCLAWILVAGRSERRSAARV